MKMRSIGAVTDDGLPINNSNLDAAISDCATQSDILDDATPFSGADVSSIKSSTDALPTLQQTGGTLTTDGTEQNMWIVNAPAGIWEPRLIRIDTTNHTAGETIVIREYHRMAVAGGWIQTDEDTYAGVVTPTGITHALTDNRYGLRITIEKTGGANRAYVWEGYYKAV